MGPRSPENHNGHRNSSNPSPEARDLPHGLANLSLDQQPSTENNTSSSNHSIRSPQEDGQGNTSDQRGNEDETAKTYRINKLSPDSDVPDSGEQDDEESSNVKPDELLNIVFNFDMPREVDLKVKIKGDFNVTVL